MTLIREFDFVQYLEENLKNYKGEQHEVINLLPDLYELLSSLLASDDLPQASRSDIYLTMGYLFYPADVYPEEVYGPKGFIDDIMLIIVVLRKIMEKMNIEFIEEFWENSYSMQDLLEKDFISLSEEYNDMLEEVLLVTGLVDETYLG